MSPQLKALETEILAALRCGMDRHWRLAKDLLVVKPEYLLTAFVADHLSGVLDVNTSIRLEWPTSKIIQDVWLSSVGWNRYAFKYTKWKGRNGKVDIYISQNPPLKCVVIELKNLDPTVAEIRKDVQRLCDLLAIQASTSPLEAGYLAFPTRTDWTSGLLEEVRASVTGDVHLTPFSEYQATGEEPEEGLHAYFSNVARFTRLAPQTASQHAVQPTASREMMITAAADGWR
jgi:hypothetical protein